MFKVAFLYPIKMIESIVGISGSFPSLEKYLSSLNGVAFVQRIRIFLTRNSVCVFDVTRKRSFDSKQGTPYGDKGSYYIDRMLARRQSLDLKILDVRIFPNDSNRFEFRHSACRDTCTPSIKLDLFFKVFKRNILRPGFSVSYSMVDLQKCQSIYFTFSSSKSGRNVGK